MRILLDTSVYSQPIKKNPLPSVVVRWKASPESEYAVSAISELEVLYGIALSGSDRLWDVYRRILQDRFPVVPFDRDCAFRYAELQAAAVKAGRTRPSFDLMIAATALVHSLELATCNAADFAGIPGLSIADWSKPE